MIACMCLRTSPKWKSGKCIFCKENQHVNGGQPDHAYPVLDMSTVECRQWLTLSLTNTRVRWDGCGPRLEARIAQVYTSSHWHDRSLTWSLAVVCLVWAVVGLRRKHWPQRPVWMLAAHVQSDQNHTSVTCPGSSFLSTWHVWARLDEWPQTMAIYLCNNQSTTAGLLVSDTRLTCPPSVAWSVTRPPCLGWSVWRI